MRILGSDIGAVEALIFINIAVFFLMFFTGPDFIENYALSQSTYMRKPWTLITSMFIHGSFNHILFNMFSLYFFGLYLGSLIGEKKLLQIYFLGGIVGGLFFVYASDPRTYAVGASGAIFALGAALAILRPNMMVFAFPIPIPMPLWMVVFGLMVIMSFIVPNTAWQGHLGGLFVGAIAGYLHKRRQPFSGHLYGMYGRYRY